MLACGGVVRPLVRQMTLTAPFARGVLRCALSASLVMTAASSAGAAPSTPATSTVVEMKRAEEAEARALLEQMKLELATLVDEYVEMGAEMVRTKEDVARVTGDLATMKLDLDTAEDALARRANELYRGDRDTMLNMLLTSSSLQELWVRSAYLTKINFRDARLVSDVRLARQENMWLQQQLYMKYDRLNALQIESDAKRKIIEKDLEEQEERARQLRVDLARLMWSSAGGAAPSGGFSPETVMSEAQFRDSGAMSAEQIQAFLDEQPGSLGAYKGRDHNGVTKTAAQMIAEAAQAQGINPKVILCVLQKEQSLLQRANPTQRAMDWAMGCGKTDSRTISKFKGFGMQIWGGAEALARNAKPWHAGISMKIDGSTISPTNSATYSLYKYTPHFRGTMSFWMLYWRYFGDPTV